MGDYHWLKILKNAFCVTKIDFEYHVREHLDLIQNGNIDLATKVKKNPMFQMRQENISSNRIRHGFCTSSSDDDIHSVLSFQIPQRVDYVMNRFSRIKVK